jgi:hypothetical protein
MVARLTCKLDRSTELAPGRSMFPCRSKSLVSASPRSTWFQGTWNTHGTWILGPNVDERPSSIRPMGDLGTSSTSDLGTVTTTRRRPKLLALTWGHCRLDGHGSWEAKGLIRPIYQGTRHHRRTWFIDDHGPLEPVCLWPLVTTTALLSTSYGHLGY